MNKIILIGCLVQNPKVVASEGKKTAAYFRVAVNRKFSKRKKNRFRRRDA